MGGGPGDGVVAMGMAVVVSTGVVMAVREHGKDDDDDDEDEPGVAPFVVVVMAGVVRFSSPGQRDSVKEKGC